MKIEVSLTFEVEVNAEEGVSQDVINAQIEDDIVGFSFKNGDGYTVTDSSVTEFEII